MSILHNMYRMRNIYFMKCIFTHRFAAHAGDTARPGPRVLTAPFHSALFAKGLSHGKA